MARVMFRMPPVRNAATAMAIALIAVSVVTAIFRLLPWVGLSVAAVTEHFFLWQVVSYTWVASEPFGVIFGGLITWSLGSALESVWGRARFVRFTLGVAVGAALLTVVLVSVLRLVTGSDLLASVAALPLPGASVLTGTIWVGYGLHIGRGQANFWGLPMTGNGLALLGVAFLGLQLAFNLGAWPVFLPEAFALAITWFVIRVGGPSDLMTRFRSWQLNRDLRRRSAHLKSLEGGRGGDRGSDKFLH